jgi:Secretion system C-terminal sorting domain
MVRFMLRALALSLILIISTGRTYACGGTGLPSYGGELSYSIDSTNPLKVNIVATLYFINNESLANDSIVINWGDASQSGLNGIYARSITPDSLAFANAPFTPNIYAHVYTGSHVYAALPAGQYYYAYLTNTYRPAGVVNIDYNDSYLVPYTIQAKICLDSSSHLFYTPPVLSPVDIFVCSGDTFTARQPAQKANGDSVVFQLISPLFTVNTSVPEYQLPSQTCGGNNDSSFTINSSTGELEWPNVCHDSVYDIATVISTYRNGTFVGSIMRDQLLYSLEAVTAVNDILASGHLNVFPNPASGVINISLPQAGNNGVLALYDIAGNEILSGKATNSILQTMDISALAQGVYLLSFKNTAGTFTQKIIKQ